MDPTLSLPHRPPVLAVTAVLARDGDVGVVAIRVPPDWSLLIDGRAPAVLGIELLAQATAAWAAGAGAPGVLLRCRAMRFAVAELPVDVDLVARVRRTDGSAGQLAAFEGRLLRGDEVLVEGTLLVQRLAP
jgi:predicted hotdog family 3-hydroxylacyl-ACP dehydratase